jgi:tricorn protease-like protein
VKIFLNGRQQVLTAPPLGATDNTPAISQSGGFTAFTRNWSTGSGDLFVVPSRGGTATRLTSEARDIVGLTWLDDDHLLYSSNRGGRFRLWQCKRWGAS